MNLIQKFFSKRQGKPGFIKEVVLHNGERTKRTAQLLHIRHAHPENDGLSLHLFKFDKPTGTQWPEELEPAKEISLKEEEVKILYDYLSSSFASLGIRESGKYAIIPVDEDISSIPSSQRALVGKLISSALQSKGEEALKDLIQALGNQPDAAAKLRNFTQRQKFQMATHELEGLVCKSNQEQDFKEWFKSNPWIFGTEYLSREDVSQIALRHRIDLCFTSADGYQDVIELKLPNMQLFKVDPNHPGSYYPTEELTKAIAQCSNYLYEIEEQRSNIERTYKLPFLKPRARIVIGRSKDWGDDYRHSLRKLNAAFHNIDIMTYDHVLVRAKKMVDYYGGKN